MFGASAPVEPEGECGRLKRKRAEEERGDVGDTRENADERKPDGRETEEL